MDGKIVKTWIGYHPGEEKEMAALAKRVMGVNTELEVFNEHIESIITDVRNIFDEILSE